MFSGLQNINTAQDAHNYQGVLSDIKQSSDTDAKAECGSVPLGTEWHLLIFLDRIQLFCNMASSTMWNDGDWDTSVNGIEPCELGFRSLNGMLLFLWHVQYIMTDLKSGNGDKQYWSRWDKKLQQWILTFFQRVLHSLGSKDVGLHQMQSEKWAAHDIRFINKSREGKGEKLWKKCWEISLPRSTTDITVVYCHLRRCVTFVSGCHVDVSRQRCMFHRNIHWIKIEVVKKWV
jgi:hypothetical protein